jgi:hypothetical protein
MEVVQLSPTELEAFRQKSLLLRRITDRMTFRVREFLHSSEDGPKVETVGAMLS